AVNRLTNRFRLAFADAIHQQSKNAFLGERDPEAVEIANDNLAHAVERVVRLLDDIDAILELFIKVIDLVRVNVEIDFASSFLTGLATLIEHHLSVSKSNDRETQSVAFIAVSGDSTETDARVPIDSGTHIGNVNHRNNLLGHELPPGTASIRDYFLC